MVVSPPPFEGLRSSLAGTAGGFASGFGLGLFSSHGVTLLHVAMVGASVSTGIHEIWKGVEAHV